MHPDVIIAFQSAKATLATNVNDGERPKKATGAGL